MKLWDILTTANSNLLRNKLRTSLTIIAVFIGGFTITLTAGVNAGVNDYINRQLGSLGGNNFVEVQAKQTIAQSSGPQEYDPNVVKGSGGALGISLSMLTDDDVAKVKKVDNIASVTPQVVSTATYIEGQNGKKYDLSVSQMIQGLDVDLASGEAPTADTSDYQIDLADSYVAPLGFASNDDAIGKTVTIAVTTPLGEIKTLTATVIGIQNNSLVASRGAVISNSLNNAIYDITTEGLSAKSKHQYLALTAQLKDYSSQDVIDQTKSNIEAAGNYTATTVKDRIGTVSTIINAVTIALIGFGVIALVAAVFGVVNTLFMAVQERTKEIGLMKAMGMSRGKVFRLFSIEAILIGFWGSAIGVILAAIVGAIVNKVAGQTFLKDLHGFTLMQFPAIYIVLIMVVIMLITFLAGTLPARRAAKQNPIDALRYE